MWASFVHTFLDVLRGVMPIVTMLMVFQIAVIRRPLLHPWKVSLGFIYVIVGVALFLEGLHRALFPLGDLMVRELTTPEFTGVVADPVHWDAYRWVYLFSGCIGFAATLAEPALIAIALKAEEISAGAIRPWGLRLAVATGASSGMMLGTFRIVTGTDIFYYILVGYVVVMVQTLFAPKCIVGLAYDSGGVTTSTVTVPIVTAIGLGLASTVPGRNPLLDGFGLIAFTCLFPIISVLGYAQVAAFWSKITRSYSKKTLS